MSAGMILAFAGVGAFAAWAIFDQRRRGRRLRKLTDEAEEWINREN